MTQEITKQNNVSRTKENERAELHRAIWHIANDLRGSVDGWDFKQYGQYLHAICVCVSVLLDRFNTVRQKDHYFHLYYSRYAVRQL